MAEYLIQDTTLDAIADAINAKTGGSSAMTPAQMVTAIGSISGGGGAIVERNVYTQVEDWTTDAKGNAANIANTYLPASANNYVGGIVEITNNSYVGNYKAIELGIARKGTQNQGGWSIRQNGASESIAATRSMYLAAGSTITVTSVSFPL